MDREALIEELIDALRGTTLSLATECEDRGLDDTDEDVTDAVDQAIFLCAECGWWADMSEEASAFVDHEELICGDCATQNHDWNGED